MRPLATLCFCIGLIGNSIANNDGYDERTIRPSDIPKDAPRFEQFKESIYSGKNATPIFNNSLSRMFRTRILEWSKEKPNFAGHYILATWGCGSSCTQITIIDAKSGAIYHPDGVGTNHAINVHGALLEGGDFWHSSGAVKFQKNSRLLMLIGMPDEDVSRNGITYYEWKENKLKLVRFISKPW